MSDVGIDFDHVGATVDWKTRERKFTAIRAGDRIESLVWLFKPSGGFQVMDSQLKLLTLAPGIHFQRIDETNFFAL